jgi:DNA-binding transcriptional MerR regulator
LDFFKEQYSIKDLESFSGIKAHTIRMWEKRHDLLQPKRTESNVRRYDENAFKRLMNVAFLNRNGYKISELSHLDDHGLNRLVQKNSIDFESSRQRYIQLLKIAMLQFDNPGIEAIYEELLEKYSMRDVFLEILVPFLKNIGLLWQTQSINPAHEHFVSNWIRKKLLAQIDLAQRQNQPKTDRTYVMFLPEQEIHDLGLLFIYHQLIAEGYQCIYLGYSLPTKYLNDLARRYMDIRFISYFSIHPENPEAFLNEFHEEIGKNYSCKLWLLGKQTEQLNKDNLRNYCKVYDNIPEILNAI